MTRRYSTKDKFLAWAMTIFGIGMTFGVWVGDVVTSSQSTEEKIEQNINRIASLQTRVAQLEDDLKLTSASAAPIRYWIGAQFGEVSARMQQKLVERARQENLRLRSISQLPTRTALETQLSLRAEGEAPLDQFVRWTVAIAQNDPPLSITRVAIRRTNRPGAASRQPLVFFQIDVAGPIQLDGG